MEATRPASACRGSACRPSFPLRRATSPNGARQPVLRVGRNCQDDGRLGSAVGVTRTVASADPTADVVGLLGVVGAGGFPLASIAITSSPAFEPAAAGRRPSGPMRAEWGEGPLETSGQSKHLLRPGPTTPVASRRPSGRGWGCWTRAYFGRPSVSFVLRDLSPAVMCWSETFSFGSFDDSTWSVVVFALPAPCPDSLSDPCSVLIARPPRSRVAVCRAVFLEPWCDYTGELGAVHLGRTKLARRPPYPPSTVARRRPRRVFCLPVPATTQSRTWATGGGPPGRSGRDGGRAVLGFKSRSRKA